MKSNKKNLPPEQREELLGTLKARFEKNMIRHKGRSLPSNLIGNELAKGCT